MRLICPNCDAEYEIEAALIPDTGRDVQCSNCGHGWFQPSPDAEAEAADEDELFGPAPVAAAPVQSAQDDEDEDEDEDDDPEPALMPAAPRSLDASVLDVLRSEAELETRVRTSEQGKLEHQGEMGLDGNAPGADSLAARISRLKDDSDAEVMAVASVIEHHGAKANALPEIDAINSTLRAKNEKRSGEAAVIVQTLEELPRAPGGFNRGFSLAITLIVLAVGLYLAAPALSARVPALAGALQTYVTVVDALRTALDGAMRRIIEQITALMGAA